MKRKILIKNSVCGLVLLGGLHAAAAAEYRCGWLDNPAPDQYQFVDKEASWDIMQRGGYQIVASSMKNLPEQQPNEFVRTNGEYGYSCSCMSVTTDVPNKRIIAILYKGQQVLLKRCLEDKAIAGRQHLVLNVPALQVTSDNGYNEVAQVSSKTVKTNDQPKPYYIQVIATSIPEKAKRLKNSFDKAGFKTIIYDVKVENGFLYRVRIGPYLDKNVAISDRTRLRQLFNKDKNVQKSIISG